MVGSPYRDFGVTMWPLVHHLAINPWLLKLGSYIIQRGVGVEGQRIAL